MRVSQVNNQIFEGKFKNSGEIKEILQYADKNSLIKFNEIIDRAAKHKDNLVFSFDKSHNFIGNIDLRIEYAYNLIKENIENAKKENIYKVIFTENFLYTPESRKNTKAKILGCYFPILEKIYPTQNSTKVTTTTENKEQIIQSILDKLI